MNLVAPILFKLHCFTRKSKSNVARLAEEAFIPFLQSSSKALSRILALVLPKENSTEDQQCVVEFGPGPSGGSVIRTKVAQHQ